MLGNEAAALTIKLALSGISPHNWRDCTESLPLNCKEFPLSNFSMLPLDFVD